MRRFALVALLLAACQSTNGKVPEGRIDTKVHPEFGRFRPVQIAVLPVKAPTLTLRLDIRKQVYDRLLPKKYSPFRLQTVDAHTNSDGTFSGSGLAWDATLQIEVERWKAVGGTRYWTGDGKAEMRHKTGTVIWSCAFENYAFELRPVAGSVEEEEAAALIAELLIARLPERPPPPPE